MGEYLSRFTFYDVMGYLLPGLLGLCAAFIGLSAINPAWAVPALSEGGHWFAVIVGAYFVGHAVQGLSYRFFPRSVLRAQIARACTPAVATVVHRAMEHHGIETADGEAAFAALDALKLDFGDREVFIARQGFFRGSSLSFGLLAVALLAACIFNGSVSLFGASIDRALCGVAGAVCAGASVLFFFRYRDFLRHELEYAAAQGAKVQKPAA
jgi:uncharacterized membrane protein YiaA